MCLRIAFIAMAQAGRKSPNSFALALQKANDSQDTDISRPFLHMSRGNSSFVVPTAAPGGMVCSLHLTRPGTPARDAQGGAGGQDPTEIILLVVSGCPEPSMFSHTQAAGSLVNLADNAAWVGWRMTSATHPSTPTCE